MFAKCATLWSEPCSSLTVDDFAGASTDSLRLGDPVELPAGGINLEQLERSLVVQAFYCSV